jgi:hypothetical protein
MEKLKTKTLLTIFEAIYNRQPCNHFVIPAKAGIQYPPLADYSGFRVKHGMTILDCLYGNRVNINY